MTATTFRLALVAGLLMSTAALAARSDWSPADQSQLRLLLTSEGDTIVGGVEMQIDQGWHTYWRNPGEAGIPPIFDFSASTNVANVEVLYPAPDRYYDGASVSLVYRDEVVFPLIVTPIDEGPVTLRVEARFGVCSTVCVPTKARSEVTLSAISDVDPLTRALLSRFRSRVPEAPRPGHFDVESVVKQGNALLVDVRMPQSTYIDLFVDPPAGWAIGQPVLVSRDGGVSRYRLAIASGPGEAASAPGAFRFVAVAGGESIEDIVEVR